eukprot:403342587
MLQPQEQENFEKWLQENKLEREEVLELFQTMSQQLQDGDHNKQRLELNQIDVQLNSQDSAFIDEGNQQPNEEEKDQRGYFKPFLSNVYNYAGNLYQRFRKRNDQEVLQNQQNNNNTNNQLSFEMDRLELDQNNEDQNQIAPINFWEAFHKYGKIVITEKPIQEEIIEPVEPILTTIEFQDEEEQNRYESYFRSIYNRYNSEAYPDNKKIAPEIILRIKKAMDIYDEKHKNENNQTITGNLFRQKDQPLLGKIIVNWKLKTQSIGRKQRDKEKYQENWKNKKDLIRYNKLKLQLKRKVLTWLRQRLVAQNASKFLKKRLKLKSLACVFFKYN